MLTASSCASKREGCCCRKRVPDRGVGRRVKRALRRSSSSVAVSGLRRWAADWLDGYGFSRVVHASGGFRWSPLFVQRGKPVERMLGCCRVTHDHHDPLAGGSDSGAPSRSGLRSGCRCCGRPARIGRRSRRVRERDRAADAPAGATQFEGDPVPITSATAPARPIAGDWPCPCRVSAGFASELWIRLR